MMERAVITGGTGMVASALTRVLERNGVEILLLVRPGSKKLSTLKTGLHTSVVECGLCDMKHLALKGKYDAFFHFGWDGTYGSGRDDAHLQNSNVEYTLDAVELSKKLGCRVFVGAGSQAEYGRVSGRLSESTHVNPQTCYGIAKYAAGKLSGIRCGQLGIRHCWVRILSLFGRGDNDYTMMMSCIRSFYEGKKMPFTKGEQVWDYLYCDDAGEAFYKIAEKGKNGSVYTLGSGKPRKLSDYIIAARDVICPDAPVALGELEYPQNQVMYLCADISKLTADTGFVPAVSFEDGVRATVKWLKETETV